ncbi:RNA polymerase sigma-70 factor [Aquiflexum sp.]|uniref:RNA polymerase sigma-70 factor n=1 Tax=Aquiflexum sp. TaxID=1872584 RepID=UPI0035936F23
MSKPKITDEFLLKGLLKKDKKAFDLIYEMYWKRLFLYAYKIFEDKAICEDVVQEVFIKLWENAEKREIQLLEPYLFRAVKYQISNAIRNLKQTSQIDQVLPLLHTELAPDNLLELEETVEAINNSVEQLPEKCRQIYILSREEHLSNKEIAHQMNISVRTVEAHLYKALSVIKKNIGEVYMWLGLAIWF